jgi:membrane-associated HD superfamily phosphohydrolase
VGLDVSYHGVYRPRTAADGNTTSVESNNDDDEERLFYERKQQLEEMREQQRSKLRRRILMMDLSVSKGSRGSKEDASRGSKEDASLASVIIEQERTDTNDSLNGDLELQTEPKVNEKLAV